MKTVRELINEAEAQGYDVIIENSEGAWDRQLCGNGWFMWCDGWTHEEHDFDSLPVVKTYTDKEDKIVYIEVDG